MSKKHFEAVAAALLNVKPARGKALDCYKNSVAALCAVFAASNPLFDVQRFRRACGLEG